MLLFSGFIFSQYQADLAAHAPGATRAAIKEWNDGLGNFYPTVAEIAKDKALRLGSWLGLVKDNLGNWKQIIPNTLVFMPDTIGLMLLGMAGYRSGFLTGEWNDAAYRRIARIAMPIGLAACGCIVAFDIWSNFYIIDVFMMCTGCANVSPLKVSTSERPSTKRWSRTSHGFHWLPSSRLIGRGMNGTGLAGSDT